MIEAHFENIKFILAKELRHATVKIRIAVAWFTDAELFDVLVLKASQKIKVELLILDDEINNNSSINHLQLDGINNSRVYKIAPSRNNTIMHNKFCIIDDKTVITGSYNWSYKARSNHENITIAKGLEPLASQFDNEFSRLINYYFNEPSINNESISTSTAIVSVSQFNSETVRFEIQSLKIEILAIEDEIITTNKKVTDFNTLYQLRLGKLILELLELKKNQATGESRYLFEKEIDDFKEYTNENSNKGWKELTNEEYQELKSVFRKATKLCHPDLVDPDSQLQAQETFNEVKRLFENNDIENLKKVLTHLESGAFITNSSLRTENEFDKLKLELNRLRIKKESLIKELQEIKNSDSYKVVINVKDIEEYFGFLEKKLINEIKELKVENL